MKKIVYLLLIWLLNGCDTCPSSQDEEDIFSQAFIGLSSRCAIKEKDKTVVCWPRSSHIFIVDGPKNVAFLQVTNGISFVCGIKEEDETVMCWGADVVNQLNSPENVAFKSITSGTSFTCGIKKADDTVVCWGKGDDGETKPPEDIAFEAIDAHSKHVCGIKKEDGTAVCWGYNNYGQTDPPEDISFVQIVVNNIESCGIDKEYGYIYCWGAGGEEYFLELGDWGERITKFEGSSSGFCGLMRHNYIWCFGDPLQGYFPPNNVKFIDFALGNGIGCGIREDDKSITCWGSEINYLGRPERNKQ
jgi:hypothetical protein